MGRERQRGPYGGGTYRQRGPNSWQLKWYVRSDGQYHYKTIRGSEKDAQRELRAIAASLDAGTYVKPVRLTVRDAVAGWLEHKYASVVSGSLKLKTYEEYHSKCELYIIPAFGKYMLDAIKPKDIQKWFDTAQASGRQDGSGGLSPQTLKHTLMLLRAVFNHYVDLEHIQRNPAKNIKIPEVKKFQHGRLDKEQVDKMLKHIRGSIYEIPIWIAMFSGVRRGEALGLHWSDVDLEHGTISIKYTLSQASGDYLTLTPPKSENSYRTIAIPKVLVEKLKQHKEWQELQKQKLGSLWQDNDLVCTNQRGGYLKPNNLSWEFKHLLESAKLPHMRFHDLRHQVGYYLQNQNVPLKVISQFLGHSTIAITADLYLSKDGELERQAVDTLDRLFGGSSERN